MKLSNTALEQFIRCPYQFNQERLKGNKGTPSQAMLMGRVVHRTIDRLLRRHKKEGRADYLDIADATDIYTKQWSVESGLHDHSKFAQGLQQIHDWIDNIGPIDPAVIYGIEYGFTLELDDGLEIAGVIDLIICREVIDEETGEVFLHVEVVDWKTSLAFTSPSDAHESLQLSLYIMAAKQLFPNATMVSGSLYMLSDGLHLPTSRTGHDLVEDTLFLKAMAQRIETEEDWEPTLNSSCIYCHLRRECPAYRDALTGPMPMAAEDMSDLDELAHEHQAVSLREKIAKKRKDEIAAILKNHLKGIPGLELGDRFYRLSQSPRKTYPPLETLSILTRQMKMKQSEAIQSVCTIANKKLDNLIKSNTSPEARMAGASLANIVKTSYSSRLTSKKLSAKKQGKKS